MPPLASKLDFISVQDYLAGEKEGSEKYEYVQGRVYAMAGAKLNHNRIVRNLSALLWNALQDQPCEPVSSDMLLKTSYDTYRYPDLMVVCDNDSSTDDYIRENPILIVEVISGSTRRKDKTEKRSEYLALPSLIEHMLIEQDIAEIEVQRRSEGWRSTYYYPGQTILLESAGISLTVEAIYARVNNEDMQHYLATLESTTTLKE